MANSLASKLLKNTTLKGRVDSLDNSKFFGKTEFIPTDIPMLNVALSGRIDGGLTPGLTVIAGPSKHFKSNYALVMVASFLKKYPDAVCLFYDSEFGITPDYLKNFKIDPDRVVHTPIMNLEELKFDIVNQLEKIEDGDKVIILIDSLGNMGSKKEIEDSLAQKSVVDMQRSKHVKSIFRMITPLLNMKKIPAIVVNHTYESMDLFPTQVVSGGCLLAGSVIKTLDGEKPIEKISKGEFVLTKDGYKEVTNTWDSNTLIEPTPECFEIEFEDGYKVTCSDKHKFLVNGEWVEAKDLTTEMDVEVI